MHAIPNVTLRIQQFPCNLYTRVSCATTSISICGLIYLKDLISTSFSLQGKILHLMIVEYCLKLILVSRDQEIRIQIRYFKTRECAIFPAPSSASVDIHLPHRGEILDPHIFSFCPVRRGLLIFLLNFRVVFFSFFMTVVFRARF